MLARPELHEYARYYHAYIERVPEGDLLALLPAQHAETVALLAALSEDQAGYRYAPDKWSIREVVGHLCDTERIFAYRALRIARGDATPLPGFDENHYVAQAAFDHRTLASLLDEWQQVRQATTALFRGFQAEAFVRTGTANSLPMSVRALAYVIAGHERHHLQILHERYGLAA